MPIHRQSTASFVLRLGIGAACVTSAGCGTPSGPTLSADDTGVSSQNAKNAGQPLPCNPKDGQLSILASGDLQVIGGSAPGVPPPPPAETTSTVYPVVASGSWVRGQTVTYQVVSVTGVNSDGATFGITASLTPVTSLPGVTVEPFEGLWLTAPVNQENFSVQVTIEATACNFTRTTTAVADFSPQDIFLPHTDPLKVPQGTTGSTSVRLWDILWPYSSGGSPNGSTLSITTAATSDWDAWLTDDSGAITFNFSAKADLRPQTLTVGLASVAPLNPGYLIDRATETVEVTCAHRRTCPSNEDWNASLCACIRTPVAPVGTGLPQ